MRGQYPDQRAGVARCLKQRKGPPSTSFGFMHAGRAQLERIRLRRHLCAPLGFWSENRGRVVAHWASSIRSGLEGTLAEHIAWRNSLAHTSQPWFKRCEAV